VKASIAAAALLLCGCAGASTLPAPVGERALAVIPRSLSGYIYVANNGGSLQNAPNAGTGSVTVYDPKTFTLVQTINNGIQTPISLAFDSKGRLYVANQVVNTITVYGSGKSTPAATIALGAYVPIWVGIDAKDDLFVWGCKNATPTALWCQNAQSEVFVYRSGATAPSYAIVNGLSGYVVTAMSLDKNGSLYVGRCEKGLGPSENSQARCPRAVYPTLFEGGSIAVYGPGKNVPGTTIVSGVDGPVGITFDPRGYLYVSNEGDEGELSVYRPGSKTAMFTNRLGKPSAAFCEKHISQGWCIDSFSSPVVFDQANDVYVDDGNLGIILVYPPDSPSLLATLEFQCWPMCSSSSVSDNIAFDRSWNLIASSGGAVYTPTQEGFFAIFGPKQVYPKKTFVPQGLDYPDTFVVRP
jgi:hypothetical protein